MRTYNQLKNNVISLVDRDDYVVSDAIGAGNTDLADQWIDNAVRRFYQTDAARTAPFELMVTGTLTAGSNMISIPQDWRQTRQIVCTRDQYSSVLTPSTTDEIFTDNTNARIFLPLTFTRQGANWFTERPQVDTAYTIYYYGVLSPIDQITSENFAETVVNYNLGRLSVVDSGGTTFFFPTGTTTEQAQSDFSTLTPTLAATTQNTVQIRLAGNRVFHWLLNNAGEVLMYWAAVEAGMYYDVSDDSIAVWDARGQGQIERIVKEDQRRDGSGSTPLQRRPNLYRQNSIYAGTQRGF